MTNESPIWTPARHPLGRFLREVATGTRPPRDGSWQRVTPWAPHVQGILGFANHAILAVSYDHTENDLADLGVDGWDGFANPRLVSTLAKDGWIDTLDMLYLGTGRGETGGGGHLVTRPDLAKHPFVEHVRRGHSEVQVFGTTDPDSADLVVLSRGVGGLREIAFRVDEHHRQEGRGHHLVDAALHAVPENELLVMCVAPHNVPAIRCIENAGLRHHGSLQLFSDRREHR